MSTTPELPRRLLDLRDGTDNPLPHEGEARKRRLARMENDINALADFVADLDRYTEYAKDAPLVGEVVGPFMAHEIALLRAKYVSRGHELHRNLLTLKKQS